MIGYTRLESECGQVTFSACLDPSWKGYTGESVSFRTRNGKELEFWDNENYITEFMDELSKDAPDYAFLEETLGNDNPDLNIDFFIVNRGMIIELYQFAQQIGFFNGN